MISGGHAVAPALKLNAASAMIVRARSRL
jgi:hypothetical protein